MIQAFNVFASRVRTFFFFHFFSLSFCADWAAWTIVCRNWCLNSMNSQTSARFAGAGSHSQVRIMCLVQLGRYQFSTQRKCISWWDGEWHWRHFVGAMQILNGYYLFTMSSEPTILRYWISRGSHFVLISPFDSKLKWPMCKKASKCLKMPTNTMIDLSCNIEIDFLSCFPNSHFILSLRIDPNQAGLFYILSIDIW